MLPSFSKALALIKVYIGIRLRRYRRGSRYEIMTLSVGGTKSIRGVPKRHNADVSGGHRCRMKDTYLSKAAIATNKSYEPPQTHHLDSYEHRPNRQL